MCRRIQRLYYQDMGKHNVYVNGLVHVRARSCDTCIFGKNSPVSVERKDEMVAKCEADGGVIPCHKHLYVGEKIHPVCRGFWNEDVNYTLRLADIMGIVEFTD